MLHAPRQKRPTPARRPARDAASTAQAAAHQACAASPRQLAQAALLQRVALQREVDKRSSPFLPAYGADEQPAWKDDPKESSVPAWAQEEYRREAKRTLICSMTPDGKIGSIYFPDGRIRTTHAQGPTREDHAQQVTLQFNVNDDEAVKEFRAQYPHLQQHKNFWDYYDQWLATIRLKDCTAANLPAWAQLVSKPEDAHQPSQGPVPQGQSLFEIFKNINGQVENWHPSRGMAAQFDTDQQTVSVLEAALRHLADKGIQDAKARNRAFYDFVIRRLPGAASWMRRPEEV